MKKILKYAAPVVLTACLLSTLRANANPVGLTVTSSLGGTGTGVVSGNQDTYDQAGSTVLLGTGGPISGWSSLQGTGTFPVPPPVAQQLSTVDVTSSAASTLTLIYSASSITVSETGGNTIDVGFTAATLSAGLTGELLVFIDEGNSGNNLDDTAASLTGLTPVYTETLSSVSSEPIIGLAAPTGTYDLTEEFIINASSSGQNAQFQATLDAVPAVPDGGMTMMLLGGVFCAMGAVRRKISK
ncbi:MAG TPA: hypothetical protein VH595_00540 [Verrucomicrobiae bacterium]|jgi:hypothetical protein|nr:hypothetical protein [Verrucomicrobiae bacterium]